MEAQVIELLNIGNQLKELLDTRLISGKHLFKTNNNNNSNNNNPRLKVLWL